MTITLLPLDVENHAGLLQTVYRATPHYWQMYGLRGAPVGQAAHDLGECGETPGRSILGMLRATEAAGGARAAELVGLLDIRLDYPGPRLASVGMVMVVEALQRQGIARAAWSLLEPWLASHAAILTARASVEQFNPAALRYFTAVGFSLTGEAARTQVRDLAVRLLYVEKRLALPPAKTE